MFSKGPMRLSAMIEAGCPKCGASPNPTTLRAQVEAGTALLKCDRCGVLSPIHEVCRVVAILGGPESAPPPEPPARENPGRKISEGGFA